MALTLPTLPIADRQLLAAPLTTLEMDAMLANYVALATAGAAATPATSSPVEVAFAKAMQEHFGNRHVLMRDIAHAAAIVHDTVTPPQAEVLDKDQYGGDSKIYF
jgi:hypothetical protein